MCLWLTPALCACAVTLSLLPAAHAAAPYASPTNPDRPKVWMDRDSGFSGVSISPDGKIIAFKERDSDGPVTFYHRETGMCFWKMTGAGGYLFAFTPDGKHFLTQAGQKVSIHEVAKRKTVRTFEIRRPHYYGSDQDRYGVGNSVLVALGNDYLISSYDLKTGKHLGDFANQGHQPMKFALSKDGKWLLTAGKKDELRVWDVEKRKLACELYEHTSKVRAIAISADGRWCASVPHSNSGFPRVFVFDRERGTEKARADLTHRGVSALFFSPDGRTLLVTGHGLHHGLGVWDWQESKVTRGGRPEVKDPRLLRSVLSNPKVEKEWNSGELHGVGVTDKGELLTIEASPTTLNRRLLRVWSCDVGRKADGGPNKPFAGDTVIRGKFGDSEIALTTTWRVAGAIHSLKWNGKEFIDSHDHGRQMQSATNLDCGKTFYPEVFNPTEAGSRHDGTGPYSSSQLLKLSAKDNELTTQTQMAFWLRPGEKSSGQPAYNDRVLSDHLLAKRVRIGYEGMANVIDYEVTFTLPKGERHTYAQFEAVTAYLPPEFEAFRAYDPKKGTLASLSDGPGEQAHPIVFATKDGKHALGVYSPDQPSKGYEQAGYGRWRFRQEKVVKWNCVFRVRDKEEVKAGEYRYRTFVVVGTLDDCATAMKKLHAKFAKE